MIKTNISLYVLIAVINMKPFLVLSGIVSKDMDHRQIIMILHEDNIDNAVKKIDDMIKSITTKQDYTVQVISYNVMRLVLRLDQGYSYIEVKEITN